MITAERVAELIARLEKQIQWDEAVGDSFAAAESRDTIAALRRLQELENQCQHNIDDLRRLKALESREVYHCNVCGGEVDLSNATKPTAKVGPGRPMKEQP